MLVPFLIGVLSWSLAEYVIHRFAGHDRRFLANPFGREHTRHHSEGGYFAPVWKKLGAAAVVVVVLGIAATAVVGLRHGVAYAVGFTSFYLYYEAFHYGLHAWAPWNAYGRWARRHHFHHHFHSPKTNHGVTSPLWDRVFGTLARPDVVRVPGKLAMRWLLDAEGAVRAPHQQDYAVRGR